MTATIHRLPQVAPVRPTGGSTVEAVAGFLADLEQAGKSRETQRAYAADLRLLTAAAPSLDAVTPAALRELFAANAHLASATRARRQASVASFTSWAYREGLLEADHMGRVARLRVEPPPPRGLTPAQVAALVTAVPTSRTRDRALFSVLASTGVRAGEALGLQRILC